MSFCTWFCVYFLWQHSIFIPCYCISGLHYFCDEMMVYYIYIFPLYPYNILCGFLYIHSLVNGHLHCLCIFVIVNYALRCIHVQVLGSAGFKFLWILLPFYFIFDKYIIFTVNYQQLISSENFLSEHTMCQWNLFLHSALISSMLFPNDSH